MRDIPSTLIVIVIIILLVVIYVNMNHKYPNINNTTDIEVEHNTNLDEYIQDTHRTSEEGEVPDEDLEPNTSIRIDMMAPRRELPAADTRNLQIITAGLGPEIRRLGAVESELSDVRVRQITNTNMLHKLYKRDVLGDYMTRGWFVQVHDVISTPHAVTLGATIDRFHGIRRICFRAQNNFPFLGIPQDPLYLPKSDFIGFRAMTVFKIPKTGYYNFKVLSDDGSRLMYQIVDSNVTLDEKHVRNLWKSLIDQWQFQAETWKYSPKLYFNQSDLVLLRFDFFQADANSSACVKVRYSETEEDSENDNPNNRLNDNYDDFNVGDLYCSLLWSDVPLMGTR